MAVRVSYHLRLSYMSLIENSLSYIQIYFTIPPPILFKVHVAICSISHKISHKKCHLTSFFDEMTFFSLFMQFVTAFIPALTGNSCCNVYMFIDIVHKRIKRKERTQLIMSINIELAAVSADTDIHYRRILYHLICRKIIYKQG